MFMEKENEKELDLITKFQIAQMKYEDERRLKEMSLQATVWPEFSNIKFPTQRWRIKNLIPMQGFVILAGISGEGKSWTAMEIAKCIASGKDFLDTEDFKVQQGKVLYIDMEMPKSEIQRRGNQIGLCSDQFYIFSSDKFNLNPESSHDFDKLDRFITEYKISTVIIDTFRAVSGGLKEERADEIREFFNLFKAFKDKEVVIIFLDHFRKPSRFEGKVPKKENLFSSQDKVASVEVLIMIQKDEASEEINVYQRKNRLGLEIKPFKISIRDDHDNEGVQHTHITFGGWIEDGETKKEQAKPIIKLILAEGGKTRKEVLDLAMEENIGEKNTSDALRELQKLEEIKVTKKGRENYYELNTAENRFFEDEKSNLF